MKIRSRLPALIKSKGLDQKTFAALSGLSPTTVGKLCRGKEGQYDKRTMIVISLFFGLKSPGDLFEFIEEEGDLQLEWAKGKDVDYKKIKR